MYNLEILEKGCEELGITLNDTQKNQFIQFYEFLVEKNKVMNLTGITEFDEVLVKHFLDSLCCVKAVDMSKVKTVMDIGTGAGFPGVPLKIAFPELRTSQPSTEEPKNMQKTKPTEKNMTSVYPEQYPVLQPCPNTVSHT